MMKKCAQIVLINDDGLVLGVSRKDDHTNMGLPGGKMDPEDMNDPITTCKRETKEETGLDISVIDLIFACHDNGFMNYTYIGTCSGEINYDEPHVVKYVKFEELNKGSFGEYNKLVEKSLKSLGINLK